MEYDLNFYQAALEELEQYLLAKDIYWPISIRAPFGTTPYPKLTLGTLLLVQQRLEATASMAVQQAQFQSLKSRLNVLRTRWRAAWVKKAQAEFPARLNLWRDFLSDYRKDPAAHYDRFGYEVNRRAMLHLLAAEADDLPQAQLELLSALDAHLKAVLQPGGFIWDASLSPAFPPDSFWFLYGGLPQS